MNYYRRLFHGVSITAVGNSTNHGVQNVQNIYHYVNSFVIDIQGNRGKRLEKMEMDSSLRSSQCICVIKVQL